MEIKRAVKSLSPEELAEISAFVAECDAVIWDLQIDADFAEGGRLRGVLDEVKSDVRARKLRELP